MTEDEYHPARAACENTCPDAMEWNSRATPNAAASMRRLKCLRLWRSKLESTVRYLGSEVDDALELSEQTEC